MSRLEDFSLKLIPQRLWVLIAGVLLLSLGCAQKVPMRAEDISDRVWLHMSSDGTIKDGFYAAPDGRLLLVNNFYEDGARWELRDDLLLLWFRAADESMLQSRQFRPLLSGEMLVLTPSTEEATPVYSAERLQGLQSHVQYFATDSAEVSTDGSGSETPLAYLQLDPADKSLRGYGGVNNFHGRYQHEGPTGFKLGPMSSTRMSGPGMDDELKLLQCLDLADTLLPVRSEIFFYQGTRLLCSFQAQ